jgi:hypothetical protein
MPCRPHTRDATRRLYLFIFAEIFFAETRRLYIYANASGLESSSLVHRLLLLKCLFPKFVSLIWFHGFFFPFFSDDGSGAPPWLPPRPSAADEEVNGALRGPAPEHERRAGPVRRRAGGRGHVRAAAADPGGAHGGDQLRGAGRVGGLGEALLPVVRLRRIRPRRRAAADADDHQTQRRHRRRCDRARQRAGVRRRSPAPSGADGGGRPAVGAPRPLIRFGPLTEPLSLCTVL